MVNKMVYSDLKKKKLRGRAKAGSLYDVCPDGNSGVSLLPGSQDGLCKSQGDEN